MRRGCALLLLLSLWLPLPASELADGETAGPYRGFVYDLEARHSYGLTFITWEETLSAQTYRLYRHTRPITAKNVADAETVLSGIPQGTVLTREPDWPLETWAVTDNGDPLSKKKGLVVVKTRKPGKVYYALACVDAAGRESAVFRTRKNSINRAVSERPGDGRAVLQRILDREGRNERVMTYVWWGGEGPDDVHFFRIATALKFTAVVRHPLMVFLGGLEAKDEFQLPYPFQPIFLFPTRIETTPSRFGDIVRWAEREYYADAKQTLLFARGAEAGLAVRLLAGGDSPAFRSLVLMGPVLGPGELACLRDSTIHLPAIVLLPPVDGKATDALLTGSRRFIAPGEGEKEQIFEAEKKPSETPTLTRTPGRR